MKKKRIIFTSLAVLAVMVFAFVGWTFRYYLIPHSFDVLSRTEGGINSDNIPSFGERRLSYGPTPPPFFGEETEIPSKDTKEASPEPALALLEGHRYRRASADIPREGGVDFEEWDGSCCVYRVAYWDGTYLWIGCTDGYIPCIPSSGFGDEVERLLNPN